MNRDHDTTLPEASHAYAGFGDFNWTPTRSGCAAPIALESGNPNGYHPDPDRRLLIPEPPPVSLELVADAHLAAHNGTEHLLDDFYLGIFQFERDKKASGLVYQAENFRLIFDLTETPTARTDYRMLGIVIKSLALLTDKLRDAEIEFTDQRGLAPGEHNLTLQDPVGNWLRITQTQPF